MFHYIPTFDDTNDKDFGVDPIMGEYFAMSREKRIEDSVELGNALEALVNVLYLIRADRCDPSKVLQWVRMADAQLNRTAQIHQRESGRLDHDAHFPCLNHPGGCPA
jgi:hypothetical protein